MTRNEQDSAQSGKVWASGLAVSGVALMVFIGSALRDQVDLRPSASFEEPRALMASRENQNIPETDYFYEMSRILKREYVEPIQDDRKLAVGAVRGMVNSLADPNSLFMEPESFRSYLNRRTGKYEGVGLDLEFRVPTGQSAAMTEESERGVLPRLVVTNVVPGGAAAKAGVKIGDQVTDVDGYWVINDSLLNRFRKAQADYLAKKIPLSQLNELRREIRTKTEHNMTPLKARDLLLNGAEGTVKVTWERQGQPRTTPLTRSRVELPSGGLQADGTYRLRFTEGAAKAFGEALADRPNLTIDLRGVSNGDEGEMLRTLGTLLPTGTYGMRTARNGAKTTPLKVIGSAPKPIAPRILVDAATGGPALTFVSVMKAHAKAPIVGSTSGQPPVFTELVQMPDGSGYSLVTARYSATAPAKTAPPKTAPAKLAPTKPAQGIKP